MRVLLADDDRVSRRLVQGHLEAAGCSVVTAGDGSAALKLAMAPDAPRVLVLDWMMPGLHGPEIIQKLREGQPDLYRYSILLTQLDGVGEAVSGFASGADDFVRKPCDPRELVARVRVGQRLIALQDRLAASNAALWTLANRDALTYLPNRRAVLECLTQASTQTRAARKPLGLAMIDIDHFKRVNDQHGHAVGDVVIRAVAARLSGQVRATNTVGRLGGEEFILVAPGIESDDLCSIADRLCEAVRADPVVAGGSEISVTVSVGSAWRSAAESCDDGELLRRADLALYEAKSTGRDRACCACIEDCEPSSSPPDRFGTPPQSAHF